MAVKTVKKKSAKTKATTVVNGTTISVFNPSGEKTQSVTVDTKGTEKIVATKLIVQALRVYRAASRQGTVATKTRGQVTGSTRKIYRQKGTGRARHGSITAPIFVGGGIVFGPQPRDFDLHLPKKMHKKAFSAVLGQQITQQKVQLIEGLAQTSGKTRDLAALFKNLKHDGKKILLVIDAKMKNAQRAARNVEGVTVRSADTVSMLDLLHHEQVVIAHEALSQVLKRAEITA
jgi:large subunit ribosomal protein L4